MKVQDIINAIEAVVPVSSACEWDNPGLLCGCADDTVSAVLTALDVDEAVIREAIAVGANLILTHHPIMFRGIKKITDDTPDGRAIRLLIQNNINLYAAHTNLDSLQNNCDVYLFNALGATDIKIIDKTSENAGLGRIGTLKKPLLPAELASAVKTALNCEHVRLAIGSTDKISKIAACSGDGTDYIAAALQMGAEAFITGDCKYHSVKDAVFCGMTVIDAGHFHTETYYKTILKQIITGKFSNLKVYCSESEKDVFAIV